MDMTTAIGLMKPSSPVMRFAGRFKQTSYGREVQRARYNGWSMLPKRIARILRGYEDCGVTDAESVINIRVGKIATAIESSENHDHRCWELMEGIDEIAHLIVDLVKFTMTHQWRVHELETIMESAFEGIVFECEGCGEMITRIEAHGNEVGMPGFRGSTPHAMCSSCNRLAHPSEDE